jgi:UDP-N-acetylmuramate dehydrogenase
MEIKRDVALAPYTTYNIGGAAKYFAILRSRQDFILASEFARDNKLKLLVLGGGSNVLISDEGFDGMVVLNRYKDLKISEDKVQVGSGYLLSLLILDLLKQGVVGLEPLYGIPGTIGGAVYQNAGAYGLEIKDVFFSAEFISNTGEFFTLNNKDMGFSYRHSFLKENSYIALEITLKLSRQDLSDAEKKLQEIKSIRITKPVGKSSGSFFKNPFPDKPAGMLIDQTGLKGLSVNDACVSYEHANYLINKKNASMQDIIELSRLVKEKVYNKFKIKLEEEVELVDNKKFAI